MNCIENVSKFTVQSLKKFEENLSFKNIFCYEPLFVEHFQAEFLQSCKIMFKMDVTKAYHNSIFNEPTYCIFLGSVS
jgi:hypothetical protein